MIRQSESITHLAAALVAAQAKMANAPKATQGQVGSAVRFYTDLATLTDLVRPVLAASELAYLQFPSGGGNGTVTLTTRIMHSSGEWLEDDLTMPAGNNGAQGVGSALTYARRYSLMSVLGIGSDDDDGAAATTQTNTRKAAAPRQQARPVEPSEPSPQRAAQKTIDNAATDAQVRLLAIECKKHGIEESDRVTFVAQLVGRPITSTHELTKYEVSRAIDDMKVAG